MNAYVYIPQTKSAQFALRANFVHACAVARPASAGHHARFGRLNVFVWGIFA